MNYKTNFTQKTELYDDLCELSDFPIQESANEDNQDSTSTPFKVIVTDSHTLTPIDTTKETVALITSMSHSWLRQILDVMAMFLMRIVSHFWRVCTAGGLILVITWWVYGGWLCLFLFCLSFIGLVYHCQDLLLYYPDQPPTARLYVDLPSTVSLPYEEHFIRTRDGVTLNSVFIKRPSPAKCHTILYLHGNAGNIGNRLMNAHGLYTCCGCNVLLVEYRGYGKSEGSPHEEGLYADAIAGMDFLLRQSDLDLSRIVVFGRSLGGAVAVHLASSMLHASHISAVILENTFTSIPDIACVVFRLGFIKHVPRILIKNKYPSIDRMSQIKQPTLLLSGLSDELIPPRMMLLLYQRCGAVLKRLLTYEKGCHNDTWTAPHYYHNIVGFLAQLDRYHRILSPEPAFQRTSLTDIHTV